KLIADSKSTHTYIRRLDREKYVALAAIVIISLTGFGGLYFHLGEVADPDIISNILYPLASFIGAILALITAYRADHRELRSGKQQQRAWLLIGLGLLANCLSGLYFTYMERSGQTVL